jgi:succinate dehydrogenase / fumarate reductase, cytochrome b subunit
MLGPYYRPQLTSVLSITHRVTGVFLSLVGVPLLLWWLVALGSGPDAYQAMLDSLSGILGVVLAVAGLFSLSFHFLNGIRHLVWDTGHMLDIDAAYRSGWAVLGASILLTIALLGVLL